MEPFDHRTGAIQSYSVGTTHMCVDILDMTRTWVAQNSSPCNTDQLVAVLMVDMGFCRMLASIMHLRQ